MGLLIMYSQACCEDKHSKDNEALCRLPAVLLMVLATASQVFKYYVFATLVKTVSHMDCVPILLFL